jgi:hypothetical protein
MKEIVLNNGMRTLVDDADYEFLSQWKWKAKRYNNKTGKYFACRNVTVNHRSEFLAMHRAILGLTDPKILVDHRDHDGLNNQRSNLRICPTQSHNNANRETFRRYRGVFRKGTKWMAKAGSQYLGTFPTPEDAARAYDVAAMQRWGEFATPNFRGVPLT